MAVCKKYYANLKSGKTYGCETCNKQFTEKKKLLAHKKIHEELATQTVPVHDLFERPFACEECGKTFSSRRTLLKHLRLHSGVLPFSCSVCNKTFYNISKWIDHNLVHTGGDLFPCSFCSQTFTKRDTFVKHLKMHTLNQLHTRGKSEENSFSQSGDMLSLGKESAYGGRFGKMKNPNHVSNLKIEGSFIRNKNVGIMHTSEKQASGMPGGHGGVSGSKPDAITHYSLFTYGHGYNSFSCSKEQLSKIATDKRLLPKDPFVCNFCLASFTRKESLKKHQLRVHAANTGTRCTFCEVCFKFFPKKDIMALVDMDKNTFSVPYLAYGSRPHDGRSSVLLVLSCSSCMFACNRVCSLCGKTVRLCDLRTHIKLHTGELVPCEKCGRIFSDDDALRSHAKLCLALCPICDKAFPNVIALNKHKGDAHGSDEDLFTTQGPVF